MADMTASRRLPRINWVMLLYLLFLMLPIYWLINMSLKTNDEILGTFSLWPQNLTFQNYVTILTDSSWYMGYVNSIIYVTMNTLLSVAVALPAAYAFSRYNFLGDKHLFFWLLTNRMAPPAVFALPFFQLYSSVGSVRHAYRGGAGAYALQRAAGGVDPRRDSCAACPRRSTRPPISTAIPFRASS